MQHIEKLPEELCCKPEPLIVLSGLDIEKNSVHKSIWKAFTSGHSRERETFKFRCRPVDHQFPRPKVKPSAAYEWFLPKGILKTGWMRKHLEEIPAVVAVFYDLDWDERQWDEKSTECAQRLGIVRSKLAGRDSKLVLVLIQKRAPLPLGEDLNAMERAQALCTKCELLGKNLFVLSHTNLLYGCITRLEGEFHDMASNYYHTRAKKVKSHKDTLNKASHQLLFVRHEFKIAFFGELKKDPALALKHYQQAYTHLLEQRMIDIHMLEMKTVAGFINYKICRLAFQSKASDAISQFRRHIEFFSNLVGMPQVAFEHEAWMSRQFEILGDLFQEAIQLSLSALMTQHPGLYYQEAARHAIARRELCSVLCTQAASLSVDGMVVPPTLASDSSAVVSGTAGFDETAFSVEFSGIHPSTGSGAETQRGKKSGANAAVELVRAQSPLRFTRRSPSTPASPVTRSPPSSGQLDTIAGSGISATEKIDGLEFYGQRPWRQGIQSMEPPNAVREREGILALQKAELTVDHSAIIILLLEQTHLQYKRYKAERMKLYPCVLMGSEYYSKGNYAKALSCYASVIGDYRRDRWREIYTFVLQHIMKCAYFTVQLSAFISAALELIGSSSQLSLSEKEQIQRLLFQLFRREPPGTHVVPELDQMSEEMMESWIKCLSSSITTSSTSSESQSMDGEQVAQAEKKSRSTSFADLCSVILETNRLNVCVECKVAFTQSRYTIDQTVQLAIFLKSYAPLPLGVYRVTVEFTHGFTNTDASETGSDRGYARATTKRTVQSWTQPFDLDPRNSFQMILLSMDSETLGQQIKVDSVHVQLTCPQTETRFSTTDRPLVTLVWYWAVADWPVTPHHTSRKSAETDVHRSSGSTRSTLWNTNFTVSKLDRDPGPVRWDLIPPEFRDQCVSVELPRIPPKWDLVGTQIHTEIQDHISKLDVSLLHVPPALTREAYTIRCDVFNTEAMDVTHMTCYVQLIERPHVTPGGAIDPDMPIRDPLLGQKSCDHLVIGEASALPPDDLSAPTCIAGSVSIPTSSTSQLDDLKSEDRVTCPISIRFLLPGPRTLRVQFAYQTVLPNPAVPDFLISVPGCIPNTNLTGTQSGQSQITAIDVCRVSAASDHLIRSHCVKSVQVDLDVREPFGLTCQTLSLEQSPISDLIVGENFLLYLTLTNTSSCELEVVNTRVELTPPVLFTDEEPDEQIANLPLSADDCASECQVLCIGRTQSNQEVINLGSYVVQWRRISSSLSSSDSSTTNETQLVTTVFSLLSCSIVDLPVRIWVDMPAFGTLLTPMNVLYVFENQTIYPQEAQILLEPSPGFMFSGQSKTKVRLLPSSPLYLSYVFLPLRSGNVVLPRLRISLARFGHTGSTEQHTLKLHMEEKMLRPIPVHLFIAPSGKGVSSLVTETSKRKVASPD